MCTHFEFYPSKSGKRKAFLIFQMIVMIMILTFSTVRSQYVVTISVAVTPPYPSRIDQYISQPNKIMATLLNSSGSDKEIFLRGTFSGEGGIIIKTDPNYKGPKSIVLHPGMPYLINQKNIEDFFSADHLVFQGISKNDLLYKGGLPEGDYTLCLRAFDYNTLQPLSEEDMGCSNTFTVTNVEPPVILLPVCGQEILSSAPQAVNFSWTRPPGMPFNGQYNLKIIQVMPGTRVPDNAIETANKPVFFETNVSVNSYLYGPVNPQLEPGSRYVVIVTAYDPSNQITFRNHGMSASCSFTWVKELSKEEK
jgi:TANFOR domain-containing protein